MSRIRAPIVLALLTTIAAAFLPTSGSTEVPTPGYAILRNHDSAADGCDTNVSMNYAMLATQPEFGIRFQPLTNCTVVAHRFNSGDGVVSVVGGALVVAQSFTHPDMSVAGVAAAASFTWTGLGGCPTIQNGHAAEPTIVPPGYTYANGYWYSCDPDSDPTDSHGNSDAWCESGPSCWPGAYDDILTYVQISGGSYHYTQASVSCLGVNVYSGESVRCAVQSGVSWSPSNGIPDLEGDDQLILAYIEPGGIVSKQID